MISDAWTDPKYNGTILDGKKEYNRDGSYKYYASDGTYKYYDQDGKYQSDYEYGKKVYVESGDYYKVYQDDGSYRCYSKDGSYKGYYDSEETGGPVGLACEHGDVNAAKVTILNKI